jgi:hypothetical protein
VAWTNCKGGGCEGCRTSSFGEEKAEQGGASGDRAARRLKGGTVGSRGGGGGGEARRGHMVAGSGRWSGECEAATTPLSGIGPMVHHPII